MTALVDDLSALEGDALAELARAPDEAALESWRVKVLGRHGALPELLRSIATLSTAERPRAGAAANRAKKALEGAYDERLRELKAQASARTLVAERVDVTLPGYGVRLGQWHPITLVRRDIERAFIRLGFSVVEGPEVEWDHYNFTLLNIPPDHPARDIMDTYYVANVGAQGDAGKSTPTGADGRAVLRTHTSPMQVRVMLAQKPPIRVVIPGKVYRNEATDATHESQFTQIEGLAVDECTTMGDLRGALTYMLRSLFGSGREVRFRCGYFPFVEPGAEFDMSCHVSGGSGCRLCKDTGWIEIGGYGMVHPKVLENVGIDPTRYSGWAFGFGFERIALLRYGVDDIRLFYGNDIRFLQQFR